MAIVFGKRSAYLRNKVWGAMAVLALLLLPLVYISSFGQLITKAGYISLIIVLVLMLVILTAIQSRKRFINRLFGGMEGEEQITDELRKLPDEYVVIRGVKVKDRLDVDCVVIGPTGVFAVEVKSHKGNIGFNGRSLTRNGRRFEKDFIKQVSSEAVLLREKIRHLAKLDLFVEAVLVFSNKHASVNFGSQKVLGCRVIGREWLREVLETGSGQRLESNFILILTNALVNEIPDKNKETKLAKFRKIIGLTQNNT